MKISLFSLCMYLMFSAHISMAEDTREPTGALISFSSQLSRDELHQKLKVQLEYHAKNLAIDHVRLLENPSLSAYKKLCQSYRQQVDVKSCEILFSSTPPRKIEDCQETDLKDSITDLLDVVQNLKADSCTFVFKEPVDLLDPELKIQDDIFKLSGLSQLWAHQQIGSDIVKEEMLSLIDTNDKSKSITHGILDGGFQKDKMKGLLGNNILEKGGSAPEHGVLVSNLINSPSIYGIAVDSKINTAVDGYSNNLLEAFDNLIGPPPEDIVTLEIHGVCELSNCKQRLEGKKDVKKEIIEVLAKNSVVVASAGNYYPLGVNDNITGNSNLILVGSATANGLVSHYSDESNDITVLAPTKEGVRTEGMNGVKEFGGTSAAAPLVSGSLSNVYRVLGDLKQNEAKQLLIATSTKLVVTEQKPQRNGKGLLNSYKMFRVALRLKEKGWPTNREALMSDPANFSFKEESRNFLNEALALMNSGDCEQRKKAFLFARKSFFLNQTTEAAELIAKFYDSQGYFSDAQFYKNLRRDKMVEQLKANVDKSAFNDPGKRHLRANFKDVGRNVGLLNIK